MNRLLHLVAVSLVVLVALGPNHARGDTPGAPHWKAGVSSTKITSVRSLHMAGCAGRKEPAEGTEQDLFGKAIAFENHEGNRVVFVTLDLIGVIEQLRTEVAGQVQEKYKLSPHALLMNASHAHCGPAYGRDDAKHYFDSLVRSLVELIDRSLEDLQPANLSYRYARCSVAMKRKVVRGNQHLKSELSARRMNS